MHKDVDFGSIYMAAVITDPIYQTPVMCWSLC